MPRKKKSKPAYRSKFEERLGDLLESKGTPFKYEYQSFAITVPVPLSQCQKCFSKDIARKTRFTPDFFLGKPLKNGDWPKDRVIVEAKGKFTARDRKRILALIGAWPEYNFAMVFMRDNKLSKRSKTRYSTWCEENGVAYCVGGFKEEWLK